ncbi:hypothetical protein CA606_07225 [Caulobacter vibrioides]|uniref:Uncharacterized protein n=1 Tax=Caulobacter vibrioides TaxID=155892 RepID=A0A290MJG6_CAUVI|nr:hypothetical protein [Caulobacter vibrioides]ATC32159.1 hypothetical protein CA606_07225 [Caulobacter vibrioides]
MSGKQNSAQSSPEKYVFTFDASGKVTSVAELEGNGRLSYDRIDRNETYNRSGDLVIKLETERGSTEWTAYGDSDRDGLWAKLASGNGAPDLPGLATLLKSAAHTVQPPSASSGAWGEDDSDNDFSADSWPGLGRDDDSSPYHDDDDGIGRGSDSDQYVFTFGADGGVTSVAEIEGNGPLKYEAIERDESYALVGAFVVKTEWDDGRPEWTVYADGNGDSRWTEVAEGYGVLNLAGVITQIEPGYLGLT